MLSFIFSHLKNITLKIVFFFKHKVNLNTFSVDTQEVFPRFLNVIKI